ncbi:MAG: aldehyde dehydrogenase family protein [Candidatus Nitrohelix vancouverensis]|uniref:Aldehyde dehydrogenase family protein n=1 Tax=Candidatus Nitrohelix vancouverensis TaxID=2705534 RepID=A0A7T0C3M2_9BACT|nr:MAG: aldehyde dehydrogenase family protein [Candidatus Nitrohelix vancouverensis]
MPDTLEILSPYDGHLIKKLVLNTEAEMETALQIASGLANNPDTRIPTPDRISILEKTADLVEQRIEDYARQAAEEGGKPLVDSRVELNRAVQGIREAARSIPHLAGREIPMNLNAASLNHMAYTLREPIGVVVAISAFNHPFNLIVHQAIPAIAAGCPVIVKPARTTPISCYNLLDCLYEAGLPPEWCQPLLCDSKIGEKLATDPRVAFLSFIGSGAVGWKLRSKLAPGTRCALEHGGAAPVIVDADADLKSALPGLAKGGFYHAGQVCVSVQKIYVHESRVDEFSHGLVELAKQLKVGDPLDASTEVGPLISKGDVDRVHEWVQEASKAGASILCGGKKIGETCYEPTVILDPPDDVNVSCSEIFGPVVVIYSFKDRLDAIRRANETKFSFQAAVYTQNLNTALDTVKRLNAKAVMVNEHTAFRVDWMPFGGRKQSGLGVGGILPAMEEMTEEKLMILKSPSV